MENIALVNPKSYSKIIMKKLLTTIFILSLATILCADILDSSAYPVPAKDETLKQAIKWYRVSAEKKALYRQAFALGTRYVEKLVKEQKLEPKTWGVVLDVDETALDNSAYYAKYMNCLDDESVFEAHVTIQGTSVALPGVKEFTQKVHDLGGYVSMVTNRDGSFEDKEGNVVDATIKMLKREGIYIDQLVTANYKDAKNPSDKNPRFKAVETGDNYDSSLMIWSNKLPAHKVIAYFGDNIQDFPLLKQKKLMDVLGESDVFNKFGNGYFILPNPMYGSWESNEFK